MFLSRYCEKARINKKVFFPSSRTICCMLIAAGASLLIEDHAGLSPRQLAIMAEDHELSEYLESQEEFQAEKLMAGGRSIQDYETPV